MISKTKENNIIFSDIYIEDENIDCVIFDIRKSVRKVLDYLLNLGHKKIGFIGGSDVINGENTIDFRQIHYIEYMKEKKLYNENFIKISNKMWTIALAAPWRPATCTQSFRRTIWKARWKCG